MTANAAAAPFRGVVNNNVPLSSLTNEWKVSAPAIHDGKVVFEDLEFQLKPQRGDFKAQSVLLLLGDAGAAALGAACWLWSWWAWSACFRGLRVRSGPVLVDVRC